VLPALAAGWRDGARECGVTKARLLTIVCVLIGALYLAKAIVRGGQFTQGDFYFSLPGQYAERLNPALWNSPDIKAARDFSAGRYLYGPTQYLTLFPIVFLNSYGAIASALLATYTVVTLAACYLLWSLVTMGEARKPVVGAAVFAIVAAFLPLTQALIQREFEVVAFLALIAACIWFARGRDAASGAAVAYLTWFKYWPIVFLSAFVMHRRYKGLASFAAASAGILLAAQLVFGLQHFIIMRTLSIIGGLVRPLGSGEVLYSVIPRGAQKSDFCRQWIWGRGTAADVRWELCGVEDRWPWFPPRVAFLTLVAVTLAVFVWSAYRLERSRPGVLTAKWAAIWEFSLLTIGGASFVHGHYYYFIVFLLPFVALAYWYATRQQPWRLAKAGLLAASYLLLNAFMIPTSWLSTLLHRDVWSVYLDSGLTLLGTVVLLALVLWELARLAQQPGITLEAAG
jgi:hypothetical protein